MLVLPVVVAAALLLPREERESTAPRCTRLGKAGTRLSGDIKICPGRYRISDHAEQGVIVVTASHTKIDLTGVTIESGDSLPGEYLGYGILSRKGDSISIRGGRIRGFRHGVRLEGGRGHRISGIDLSGSRSQVLRSTREKYDEADWLDIFKQYAFEAYGSGIYLKNTVGVHIVGVIARNSQNGIGLYESREAVISDNDVSNNSGWGIHLWQSSRNTIVRNNASHNVRCEGASYSRGCDSAALLLRHQSDSNLIAENNLSWSGDGLFLSGHRPLVEPSIGNVVIRNDASNSYHNAFEATFSTWNTFLENRADSSNYGFWLGYSRASVVRGNLVLGTRTAGIAIEHGAENDISGNTIIGGRDGIRLFAPNPADEESVSYRLDDNVLARLERGVVLERTSRSRLRGNLFDGVREGIVVDSAGADTQLGGNIFISAEKWMIRAPRLDAGGNYWGNPDSAQVRRKLDGRITIAPFRSAREAGY